MILHQAQSKIASSRARFKVWRAGRRTGKTVYAVEETKGASTMIDKGRVLYLASTQVQARDIVWDILKDEFSDSGSKKNEVRLEIVTPNKFKTTSFIKLAGWETRDRLRGQAFDLIIIDELDSLVDFLKDFNEIIKPLVLDRKGKIILIGTPKDSNPNLQTMKDQFKDDEDWEFFHSTSYDNPHLDPVEIDKEEKGLSPQSFRQEWLAEYGDGTTKLFDPVAVNDMFSTTLLPSRDMTPYLICDPASSDVNKSGEQKLDKSAFGRFTGFEVWLDEKEGMSSDDIENRFLSEEKEASIPRANLMIDGIGIGDPIADRQQLRGMTVFKGSFGAINTDIDISKALPGTVDVKPTKSEFKNLRTQCYFALAHMINTRQIRVHCTQEQAEELKRELGATVEKENERLKLLIPKTEIKRLVGHSPDKADVLSMRMFYHLKEKEAIKTGVVSTPREKRRSLQVTKQPRRGR